MGVSSAFVVIGALLFGAAHASATPVATSDDSYAALGDRVFPDPLAGCQNLGTEPCSPNAQGNVPAVQFIQIGEFLDALEYMNSKPDWQRFMEVLPLDGKIGANGADEEVPDADLAAGDTPGDAMFPGNTQPLEFDPKPEYKSAGLPTSTLGRTRSDLIAIRVTDETVPDAGKERYALSLSIHGIERAGVEGGTRAAEDLITALTSGKFDQPIVSEEVDPTAPTFGDVLKNTIIYFTYPNPDGWRRGSISEGGFFFQRYNGNGVDVNRDWPDIGFSYRPYSGLSEPESIGLSGFLTGVQETTGSQFSAGDDLHGQATADALSFTLLPHGRHDFEKNERIRNTAITIHRASEQALLWSPIVQPNDAEPGGGVPCAPTVAFGDACAQIYGQTWGTVYDTIDYTTTGALGDWFDSSVGLGADGIDNEMSFSHIDKNITFDPHTEQLHVDGNKALIYAHLTTILDPVEHVFDPSGTEGYVPNVRLTREQQAFQAGPPAGTVAQDDIVGQQGTIGDNGSVTFPIEVKGGPQADGTNIFNGGMQVNVEQQNVQGVSTGIVHLAVQCKGCDEHPGVAEDDEWITVGEDFNQAPTYAQAGVTVAINRPEALKADGSPVEWRAVLSGNVADVAFPPTSGAVVAAMDVDFKQERATIDGPTGGDDPPQLAAYDVANTDFFEDLNGSIEDPAERFQKVDPRAVIAGRQSLDGLDSLALADDALPGYTENDGNATAVGPPTPDQDFEMQKSTTPNQGAESCDPSATSAERFEFTIGADDGNESLTGTVTWTDPAHDYDVFLLRIEGGQESEVDSSVAFNLASGTAREVVEATRPEPGDYAIEVVNCTAAPTSDVDPWQGKLEFEPAAGPPPASAYTDAERDAWFGALSDYVQGGGNLVLTDGALQALPELVDIPADAVSRRTVYVGQMTFDLSNADGDETYDDDDPLVRDVDQEGSRYNTGFRRQTFEPTPLGFAIQNAATGNDESHARQYDVDRAAWEAAGGRTVATGTTESPSATPVYDRVTYGELPLGDGTIRIAGALLPQPSEEFDHTLGLEPYSVTYTGYILVCNLLDCTVRDASAAPPANTGGGDTGGSAGTGGGDNTGGGGPGGDTGGGDGGDAPPSGTPGRTCQGERVTISGTGDGDHLVGSRRDDVIRAGSGDDVIRGGRGDDVICAGSGDDVARGGPGEDRINGGPGEDRCKGTNDKLRNC